MMHPFGYRNSNSIELKCNRLSQLNSEWRTMLQASGMTLTAFISRMKLSKEEADV